MQGQGLGGFVGQGMKGSAFTLPGLPTPATQGMEAKKKAALSLVGGGAAALINGTVQAALPAACAAGDIVVLIGTLNNAIVPTFSGNKTTIAGQQITNGVTFADQWTGWAVLKDTAPMTITGHGADIAAWAVFRGATSAVLRGQDYTLGSARTPNISNMTTKGIGLVAGLATLSVAPDPVPAAVPAPGFAPVGVWADSSPNRAAFAYATSFVGNLGWAGQSWDYFAMVAFDLMP